MGSGITIGYVNFTILLFVFTGGLMLRFDVKGYQMKGMKKEEKTARVLGWLNIALGVVAFIGNWIIKNVM